MIILNDSNSSSSGMNLLNGHYSGDNASTVVISSSNETQNDNAITVGFENDNENNATSSDISTLTAESNATFNGTLNYPQSTRKYGVGGHDHTYSNLRDGLAEDLNGMAQDLNGTCNIDLNKFMDGDSSEDETPLSGSQNDSEENVHH